MRRSRPLLVAIATLVLALGVCTSAEALPFPPSYFWDDSSLVTGTWTSFDNPDIDGRYVVYQMTPMANPPMVWAYDLRTGLKSRVSPDDGHSHLNPKVSAGRVVWRDDRNGNWDIYALDLRTGVETQITSHVDDDLYPEIDGNIVVWRRTVGAFMKVFWYDFETGVTTEVPGGNTPYFGVDNRRVAMNEISGSPNIHLYDLRTRTETAVTGFAPADQQYAWYPAIHGDSVAWRYSDNFVNDNTVALWNRRTHAWTPLTGGAGDFTPVDVFDDKLAFVEPHVPSAIRLIESAPAYDLYPAGHDATMAAPSIWSDRVVFTGWKSPAGIWITTSTPDTTRAAGTSRYDTACEVSRRHFKASNNVVLATGENFPDALSASGLAGALDAPILLTRPTQIPAEVWTEITRLGAKKVWIIGSQAAISSGVYADIVTIHHLQAERIGGWNRYETAQKVAQRVWELDTQGGGEWSGAVFVANGMNYPDALSVSPVAYALRAPVLLVQPSSVPTPTEKAIEDLDLRKAYVIGGEPAVSAATYAAFANDFYFNGGTFMSRWAGADRYATAATVANEALSRRWLDLDMVGLATGTGFADALGGGAACGAFGSPLLLTSPTSLSSATSGFFTNHQWEIGGLETFGSESAVAASTHSAARTLLR